MKETFEYDFVLIIPYERFSLKATSKDIERMGGKVIFINVQQIKFITKSDRELAKNLNDVSTNLFGDSSLFDPFTWHPVSNAVFVYIQAEKDKKKTIIEKFKAQKTHTHETYACNL